jgi:AbrB family looped-hinge helix DNA binding protein
VGRLFSSGPDYRIELLDDADDLQFFNLCSSWFSRSRPSVQASSVRCSPLRRYADTPHLAPPDHWQLTLATFLPPPYGIANGMKLKIDKAGRIVVPKHLRERLGFTPDTKLEAIEQPEGVLLKRVEQPPAMVKVDGLWVHQGSAEPGANWERILEEVREERSDSVSKG